MPTGVSPSLTPDPKQPTASVQRTPSPTSTAEPGIDPPASVVISEDSPQPRKSPIWLSYLGIFLVFALVFVGLFTDSGDNKVVDQLSPDENGVAILGQVTRFDWLDTHKLFVTWSILGLGEYELQASDDYVPPDRAVDVYLNDASTPAFLYDPTRLPMTETGKRLLPQDLVSFGMKHRITTGDQYLTPLDRYNFTAFAFVIEKATNKSVPIATFAVGDAGPADFTTTSVDVLTRNNFTYGTEDGAATVEVASHTISTKVEHSTRAQALTFSMFAINWVLTLCLVAIPLIVFRRQGEVKDGVAFLPITVILTIPTIRSLYAGSPPFGIYLDAYGFFPQMLIVLVCTMMVLWAFATQSARERGISLERKEV